MAEFRFTFVVECETYEQALTVVGERMGPDEDYGFPYTVTMPQAVHVRAQTDEAAALMLDSGI